jgi:flagellar motility protein MotE (MotC chaperone)
MPKRSNSSNKGVLLIVTAFLVISGGLRIVLGSGPTIAFAEEQIAALSEPTPQVDTVPAPDIGDLLSALQEREARVAAREQAISDRLQALRVAEAQLSERLAELEAAEASLSDTLAVAETANDGDIMRLTAVYENMKPADAAKLFEEMAPEFASGFLVRMRPDAAAGIFAGLEPTTAYSISAIIAGRNANVPTE